MKTLAVLLLVGAAEAASFSAPRGVSLPSAPLSAPAAVSLPAGPLPGAPAEGFPMAAGISGVAGAAKPVSLPSLPAAVPALAAPSRDIPAPERRSPAGPLSAGGQARALAAAAPGAASTAFDNAAPAVPDKKDLEKVDPLSLEPMQIPVGMREVEEKEKKLRGMDEKDQKKWLQEKAVPYVMRRGKRRPIDHHHETRAAWQAGLGHVYAYSAVDKKEQERLDELTDAQFWAEMKRRGWFYDRDQYGQGPHGPEHLPEDTRGHADDPFRSLAGEVRKRGGYDKSSTPFAEFAWANFFRTRVKSYPRGDDYDKAVEEALALARTPAAQDLPGYKGAK